MVNQWLWVGYWGSVAVGSLCLLKVGRCGCGRSLWFGRCCFAILVGCCGLVAVGWSLCWSVGYESATLQDLRNF